MDNFEKYRKNFDWKKPKNRRWTDNEIKTAPMWCSVDLRDGNQALANPMNMEEKLIFFKKLLDIGFKEIEVGFPAASDTEYNFIRYLIENVLIPEDVKIQVITLAREDTIKRTFESVAGAKNVIIHLYNSISKIQREVVFGKSREEVKKLAVDGAKSICNYAKLYPQTNWQFEYSPESFTSAEVDFALDVINGVLGEWEGSTKEKPIINITATIECSTPNVFADQVEYVIENIQNRDEVIISIHSHNDRGTGVATSELGLLAGAERIEGTLFGNGERTGNADIMNIAMNMYAVGVDPKLNFSNMNEVRDIYEKCTKMSVDPRHPYAGELVFTAFSGSHQDAISKGLKSIENNQMDYWEVPYLPIDPADINRQYESIIRVNSQSGKGGVSYILEKEYGYVIPKNMKSEVGTFIKGLSDRKNTELTCSQIVEAFRQEYENVNSPIRIKKYSIEDGDEVELKVELDLGDKVENKQGTGNGPVDAFIGIIKNMGYDFEFMYYHQDSNNSANEKSVVITYINIRRNGKDYWSIGRDEDMIKSGLLGVAGAINKAFR